MSHLAISTINDNLPGYLVPGASTIDQCASTYKSCLYIITFERYCVAVYWNAVVSYLWAYLVALICDLSGCHSVKMVSFASISLHVDKFLIAFPLLYPHNYLFSNQSNAVPRLLLCIGLDKFSIP